MSPISSSPLTWVGGKHALRRHIISRLPADAECYAEAFAGAAWVLFGKPPHPLEVLNDADGDLVNLWRVLKWRPAELLEEVQKHLYSREWFDALKAQRPAGADELERAVWLYLVIQMSFGSDVSRLPSAAFGYSKKARGRLFPARSRDRFELAARRLENVLVEHLDFADLIRRYDQPHTLFYCDPPYLGTQGYAHEFALADHERLCAALGGIAGRFLLTVNDHPHLRRLYAGFRIEAASEARRLGPSPSARKAAPVLLVSNFEPPTPSR